MKTNFDIWKWLAPVVLLLAPACGYDEELPPEVNQEEQAPYVEVRIAVPIANPSATRANPMGGEEGNGREHGILNEDKIRDINVFFYLEKKDEDGKGLGMDSPDDTDIIKHIYYNLKDSNDPFNTPLVSVNENSDQNAPGYFEYGYISLRFQCTEEELNQAKTNGINFVAIANVGPLQSNTLSTLGALRDIDFSNDNTWSTTYDAYSKDASKMDYFLMSTAYNSEGSKYGYNKIEASGDNYTGSTTLQRMYARLDLWYNETVNAVKDGEKIKELKYTVGNSTVYLTNVLPVNVMQKPSYLFKKVMELPDGTDSWNALSNNSVWESTSNVWTGGPYKWGGKESPNDTPTATAGNDRPLNYVMERHTLDKSPSGSNDATLESWYKNSRTSKVKEDIQTAADGKFLAYYHMNRTALGSDPTDYDCNHISIIGYANENTHPTDCFHSNYLTGLAFRAVYVPAMIYSDYVENVKDAKGNSVWSFTELTGTPQKIYRYSPTAKDLKESESLYFSDRTVAENYAKANPGDMAIITEYTASQHDGKWGFICYYNLWLRHYNNEAGDPTENYPMEYATVRNNIYRVSVSFRGPGDPTPTMREPDTMQARIFVRKWNYREEPTITF